MWWFSAITQVAITWTKWHWAIILTIVDWDLLSYPPAQQSWRGYTGFILSVHQSVCPSCPLCIFYNTQSGTKPNLVAKIWPPNLVTVCAWLPKLVANVSSNFYHLVNTGLAVGSFFKWLPITVAHTCKLDTIWVVYISPIGNGSIQL